MTDFLLGLFLWAFLFVLAVIAGDGPLADGLYGFLVYK